MDQNQDTYSLAQVAAGYSRESNLQPPEETILRLMLPRLATATMLDLGVGGGRTTLHFAKWVREYVGADYSPAMIEQCQKRFSGYPGHLSFQVCDARSMDRFAGGSFDFILFSFNGIDYVNQEERLKVLKEIQRVGKPGGYFCFSSHNLNWCANFFEWRRIISFNPKLALQSAKRLRRRFFFNRGLHAAAVKQSPYILFNDGAHGNLRTYYVRPLDQLAQLQSDFTDVRVFSLASGLEIRDQRELRNNEDCWLYYLCRLR